MIGRKEGCTGFRYGRLQRNPLKSVQSVSEPGEVSKVNIWKVVILHIISVQYTTYTSGKKKKST
jgi:hypothetical protein